MIRASGYSQIETVERFPALSEIPGSACAYSGIDLGEKIVMIGIVLSKNADVPFSAGNIHAPAGGIVIQVVRILDSRKRCNQAS